jgi:predicted nucleic acid-binding protein
MTMAMEADLLPRRALIDSGVLMRALEPHHRDAIAPVCMLFWETMLAHELEILVAAPTLAELIRSGASGDVPRADNVEVVAFDDEAAMLLGKTFPVETLKSVRDTQGCLSLTHLKYDAMIVACAIRHRAECIIAIDPDIPRLGQMVKIPVVSPLHFVQPQSVITLAQALPPSGTP